MCNGDVSPLSWHVNVPVKTFAVPRFATAHTCRNFEKIRAWGKANSAGNFNFSLTPAKATEIIEIQAGVMILRRILKIFGRLSLETNFSNIGGRILRLQNQSHKVTRLLWILI